MASQWLTNGERTKTLNSYDNGTSENLSAVSNDMKTRYTRTLTSSLIRLRGANVLVTGGAGFIGSRLVERLRAEVPGVKLSAIDNYRYGSNSVGSWGDCNEFTVHAQPHFVFHLACVNQVAAENDAMNACRTNTDFIARMKEWPRAKLIAASSVSVYGNQQGSLAFNEAAEHRPMTWYAATKSNMEALILQLPNPWTILRLSNVYGPNMLLHSEYCGVVGKFIKAHLRGQRLPVYGSGYETRQYTFVDDVVDALIMSAGRAADHSILNIAGTECVSTRRLALEIAPGALLERFPARKVDSVETRSICTERAKHVLNWYPQTSLSAGIAQTKHWASRHV